MPKPITEWDDGIIEAMFAGLPVGALIARTVRGVVVANTTGELEVQQDPPCSTTLTCELVQAGESCNYAVSINCDDLQSAMRRERRLRERMQALIEEGAAW